MAERGHSISKAIGGTCAGVLLALVACGGTSASQVAAAPSNVGDVNPQLPPEMFSPKPSGPLQSMKVPKPAAEPTMITESPIMRPRRSKAKHTSRAIVSAQHVTKKHFARYRQVARRRPLDIRSPFD